MSKRILFIVPSLKSAGPVNVCLTLIKNIPNQFQIEVIALNDGERKSEFASCAKVVIFKRTALLKILKYIKAGNFAVIHSHCTVSDIFNFLSYSTAVKVTTIHNYFEYDFVQTKGFIKGHLEGVVGRYIVRKFNKVACSLSVMEHCLKKYDMKKMIAIPNGVESQGEVIKKGDGNIHFYYLGVLNKRKNVQQILDAFSIWCGDRKVMLHIIGTGSDELDLKHKYSNDKIVFHGHVDVPFIVYQHFDCFVSASHNEGLPLALLESMSAGKSFICSNIAPHVEVLNAFHQPAGFIYDKTSSGLIQCLDEYYCSSEKNNMSLNAIKSYQENFSAVKMALRYIDHYQKI